MKIQFHGENGTLHKYLYQQYIQIMLTKYRKESALTTKKERKNQVTVNCYKLKVSLIIRLNVN